jgi:hypothetical protein
VNVIRALIVVATLCAVALVAALVVAPSWPLVAAIVALLACAAIVLVTRERAETQRFVADLDAAKDTRLDATARESAVKTQALMLEVKKILDDHDGQIRTLRSNQSVAGMRGRVA